MTTVQRLRPHLMSLAIAMLAAFPVLAQQATSDREAMRARIEARRAEQPDKQPRTTPAMAERVRLEGALREALARAVRQRLNLNDQQASRLTDVNKKFSDSRLALARDEMRIRRDLRQSLSGGDSARSPATAQQLDDLLDVQRKRLELQQKEQAELSEFLTPEQRARYIAMMEQLRRRIQQRADSGRGSAPAE